MIFQCVPNLSEGRDPGKLRRIAEALSAVAGAELIDYSADADHNRSVFTLIGGEEGLLAAVVRLFEQAEGLIDMRKHQGVHPRIGAVDVVPFVPLFGAPMRSAEELCRRAALTVSERFKVPVYFYGKNAANVNRQRLAYLRRGGWEALQGRDLSGDERRPDLGPVRLHETLGASCFGARGPLVAFNILLKSGDVGAAKAIARRIRASSGGMTGVQALGLYLPSIGQAQVSMNITDIDAAPLHSVLAAVSREAAALGVEIDRSELIGVMPIASVCGAAAEALKLPDLRSSCFLESGACRLLQ